jgi:hypothetical protein
MVRCVWLRLGRLVSVRLTTFRPAVWLLPLLVSPAAWLEALAWNNGANRVDGNVAALTYAPVVGTVTLSPDGLLTITSPNPTDPGQAYFDLPAVSSGWVRFNGTLASSARYELSELHVVASPTAGGVGQGSYTVVPPDQKPPAPATPITTALSSFTIVGGSIAQVTGPSFAAGRVQNLLSWQAGGFTSATTATGAAGDAGLNPFSPLGTPAVGGVTQWNTKQQVHLLAYPLGATPQSVAGQFVLIGQGPTQIQGNAVAVLSSLGAGAYQIYRPASAGTVSGGGIALGSGEVIELQGSLNVTGNLSNTGPNLGALMLGGHGDSSAAVQFTASSVVSTDLIIQDDPARVFPFAVSTGVAATVNPSNFVLMEGSKVSIGSGITLNPANLALHGGAALTLSDATIPLSVSSTTTLGGTLTGATSQVLNLGNTTATLSSSAIAAPSGTVNLGSLTVPAGAGLTVGAPLGTVSATGTVTTAAASGSLSAGSLSVVAKDVTFAGAAISGGTSIQATDSIALNGTTQLDNGATLSVSGDAPTALNSLNVVPTHVGNFVKSSGAGAVTIGGISVPAGSTLNVGANGTALMTIGSVGNLAGALAVTGTGNVQVGTITATGANSSLSVGGTGNFTFTGGITINAGQGFTLQSIAPDALTVPAAIPITFGGAGTLKLQGPVTFDPPLTLNGSPQNLGLLGGGTRVASATFTGGGLSVSNADNRIQNLVVASPLTVTGTGQVTLGTVSGGAATTSATATIILNGSSSVTAPQSITASTLKLTGNPTLVAGTSLIGAPTLEIAGNLNQNLGALTIQGGQILFSGSSLLQGSGTLAATGAGGGSGDITAQSPAVVTLAGINLQAQRDVVINSGSSLGGAGTIRVGNGGTGLLKAAGTLVAGNPVGTLTVQGPVTFQSSGGFESRVTPSGVGLLQVSAGPSGAGVATLAGDLGVTLTGLKPKLGTTYTVIQAGSVVGTFNEVGGSAGILTFRAIYTPTEVQVAVTLPPGGLCSLATPCSAAEAVACALDQVLAEDCMTPCFEEFLYDQIFYPSTAINVIWQELAGGPYTDLPQLVGLQMMMNQDVIRSQQWMLLDQWRMGEQTQIWFDPTGDAISSTGWRMQAGGAQLGVSHTWNSGVGFGLGATVEGVRMRSKTFSLHGSGLNLALTPMLSYVPHWRSGFWRSYVLASASAGGLVTSLNRLMSWPGFCCEANSHWNPLDLSGRLEAGLSYRDCAIALQPFAALSAFKVFTGSIQENCGCCAGLDVSCWQESFGFLETGFRWRDHLCAMGTTFAPELDLGVYALLWGRGSEMSASFQQACCASWHLCGPALSRWGAFGGFGLQASASDCLSIGIRFDGRFASAYQAWSATAQASWRF